MPTRYVHIVPRPQVKKGETTDEERPYVVVTTTNDLVDLPSWKDFCALFPRRPRKIRIEDSRQHETPLLPFFYQGKHGERPFKPRDEFTIISSYEIVDSIQSTSQRALTSTLLCELRQWTKDANITQAFISDSYAHEVYKLTCSMSKSEYDEMESIKCKISDQDISDQIKTIREGLPAFYLKNLSAEIGLSVDQLAAELHLDLTDIQRKIAARANLTPVETDRIYRVEKTLSRAREVLEDESSAKAWVVSKIRSIGGVTPLSLLDTDAGTDLVLDTLSRIEQGIAA